MLTPIAFFPNNALTTPRLTRFVLFVHDSPTPPRYAVTKIDQATQIDARKRLVHAMRDTHNHSYSQDLQLNSKKYELRSRNPDSGLDDEGNGYGRKMNAMEAFRARMHRN